MRYSPSVAVLAATLIAVIWYSYFTFRSVHQVEESRVVEKKDNIRQLVSRLMMIRGRVLGLKAQLDFWHKPNEKSPVHLFAVRYVDSEIRELESQIIHMSSLLAKVPSGSQADVDTGMFHLQSVRAGLQPLIVTLETTRVESLNPSNINKQIQDTLDGFTTVVESLRSAVDRLTSDDQPFAKEVAEYFRNFSGALKESSQTLPHKPPAPSSSNR